MNLMKQERALTNTHTGQEALEGLMKGAEMVYEPVSSTLGAAGRTVIIEDLYGQPKPTKDGFTVAKSITPLDPVQRMGAEIIKQASIKTAEDAGDGTTTSCILSYNILLEALSLIDSKYSYSQFDRGMQLAVEDITNYLEVEAHPVKKEDIVRVATISANNDGELGKIIAEAFIDAGENGMVIMRPSSNYKTSTSTTRGYELDKGFSNEVFSLGKSKVEYSKPLILLSTVKIEKVDQIIQFLEVATQTGDPLVIVAEVDEDVQGILAHNVVNTKQIKCVVIPPSHFGVRRRDIMKDLAHYTGSTLIDADLNSNFEAYDTSALGLVDQVVVTKNKTVFIGGQDTTEYVQNLKDDYNEENETEKKFLEERIAKISSAISFVYVGASSESELAEKNDRVEDAIFATRAAIESGVVPGAGVALANASDSFSQMNVVDAYNSGYKAVMKACYSPFAKILSNSGVPYKEPEPNPEDNVRYGYDAINDKWGDVMEMGIMDPLKVTVSALRNAVSAASRILSTSTVITNITK